ncbi:MAG: sialate O-acetylesterase [Clostridia bacterium]|nr:sialate O-acetylesterase [Clostridia bacterium]
MKDLCDYMVIQRDENGFGQAWFRGTYEPADKNTVVVARVVREDDNVMVVTWQKCDTDGKNWEIFLTIPQGGLYRVEARQAPCEMTLSFNRYDWEKLIKCVYHVGVGDVFVMAGQSNMSGYSRDPAYDPPQLGISLFDNSGNWVLAAHPLNSVPDPIYPNNDDSSSNGPGLSFARTMMRQLNVPIGIVSAAKGGSSLEDWNPAETEERYLYDSLLKKLEAVGRFKGMIWYQGCNETVEEDEAQTYLEKFRETVSLWREELGYFPIATCQINRHAWNLEDRERRWGMVREAQRQAALQIPDVYIVPTTDCTSSDGIHNNSASSVVVGERLANVMLKNYYKLPGFSAPSVKRVKRVDSRTVLLEFHETHMIRTMDDRAQGLNIEDENGIAECVKTTADPDGILVTCERDIGENAVFHAYWKRDVPAFLLRDIYGMPMLACYGVKIED